MCVWDDKVIVDDGGNRRIQIFTRNGEYKGELGYPQKRFEEVWDIDVIGDTLLFLVSTLPVREKESRFFEWNFWLLDLNGNNIKNFLTYTTFLQFKRGYITTPLFPAYSKALKDRIFIVDKRKDIRYKIFIYSSSGEKLKEIEREYKVRKVPLALREYMEDQIKNSVKESFTSPMGVEWKLKILFPEYLPAIRDMAIDGDKLLVRTWEKWWDAVKKEKDESKRQYEIDVYSTDGEYLGRGVTNLDLQGTVFTKDFVYEMTQIPLYYENVIHVYRRTKK